MEYVPRVINPSRAGRRVHTLGPEGAPVIGYRPTPLVAATPLRGCTSRVGRGFNKVLRLNLKAIWIWPQPHFGVAKKRFLFLKTRYSHEFVRLSRADHAILGMLTRTSWNVVRNAVLDSVSPRERRARPSYLSPDPNTIRALHSHEESLARCKRRKRQRVRRRGRHFRDPAVRDSLFQRVTQTPSWGIRDTISDNFAIRERRNQDYVVPAPLPPPPPPPSVASSAYTSLGMLPPRRAGITRHSFFYSAYMRDGPKHLDRLGFCGPCYDECLNIVQRNPPGTSPFVGKSYHDCRHDWQRPT